MKKRSSLQKLKNIGPETERWLNEIDIYSARDLEEYGVIRAYTMLKKSGFPVTRNFLYAAKGALLDVEWNALPESIKDHLNRQADEMR